jgi:ribosomal protein S18 acetylase RimI-like enzyme
MELQLRLASPADNTALLALTAACPMAGMVVVCNDRQPDFFTLNRLDGGAWAVGIAEHPVAGVVGCVSLAERTVHIRGAPASTFYVSDLKVHPAFRGRGVAERLTRFVQEIASARGPLVPVLLTVLAGNTAMARWLSGPRALSRVTRIAALRLHAMPLLWHRPIPRANGLTVRPGEAGDMDDMAECWRRVAPGRQFAPVLDAEALARWSAYVPGLSPGSYWFARGRDGRLVGFVALWDRSACAQLRVLRYGWRGSLLRAAMGALGRSIGAPPLPPAGAPLRHLSGLHVCVPPSRPDVLRALLLHAAAAARGSGYVFFTVGLDRCDPLAAALRGLLALSTDIDAYVTTCAGRYAGPPLDDRPLHYETALV